MTQRSPFRIVAAALFTMAVGPMVTPLAAATVNGPIRVSADGRHFVDRDGRPFFWLGDTAWPLFAQYTKAQAEAYLAEPRRQGLHGHPGRARLGPRQRHREQDAARERERRQALAQRRPRARRTTPTSATSTTSSSSRTSRASSSRCSRPGATTSTTCPRSTPTNARAYGRWLGARYRSAPNVVWVNGGDRMPTGFEDVYRELARGLREGDGGAHLITYHPCGWRSSSQFFHDEDWLDFDMIETWTEWAKIHPAVLADALLSPRKPVVLGEGAYENGPEYPQGPITPLVVRRQAWWTVMAGGFHTYGQNQMWRMEPGWEKTFDTPGAGQVARMKEIVTSLPWWEMTPDQGLFATGVGSERTLNAALRSVRGDRALVYLSSQCTFMLHLDKIAAKNVRVTWISPTTGERRDAGTYLTGNLNGKTFPEGRTQASPCPAIGRTRCCCSNPRRRSEALAMNRREFLETVAAAAAVPALARPRTPATRVGHARLRPALPPSSAAGQQPRASRRRGRHEGESADARGRPRPGEGAAGGRAGTVHVVQQLRRDEARRGTGAHAGGEGRSPGLRRDEVPRRRRRSGAAPHLCARRRSARADTDSLPGSGSLPERRHLEHRLREDVRVDPQGLPEDDVHRACRCVLGQPQRGLSQRSGLSDRPHQARRCHRQLAGRPSQSVRRHLGQFRQQRASHAIRSSPPIS